MKKQMCMVAACLTLALPAMAEESAGEKVDSTTHGAGRELKKAGNRVGETFCTGTPAECEAEKAKHRVHETKDAAVDKAKEVKNKIDR